MKIETETKTYAKESGHWYKTDGTPCYEVPKAKGDGMRKTTLADARKLNLLPSVTTILGILDKPALVKWKQKNAIEAALTTPRIDGESVDAFAERVLSVDAESISDAAKQRGTDIHALIEQALGDDLSVLVGNPLAAFVQPVLDACKPFGGVLAAEKTVVGNGYAGKLDAVFILGELLMVVDFKTTKTIPRQQYDEHRLQLSAYANTFKEYKYIKTANIYIDSNEAGKIAVHTDEQWLDAFENGFNPILNYWQWVKGYNPNAPKI